MTRRQTEEAHRYPVLLLSGRTTTAGTTRRVTSTPKLPSCQEARTTGQRGRLYDLHQKSGAFPARYIVRSARNPPKLAGFSPELFRHL